MRVLFVLVGALKSNLKPPDMIAQFRPGENFRVNQIHQITEDSRFIDSPVD
jgi:hypothetical protein